MTRFEQDARLVEDTRRDLGGLLPPVVQRVEARLADGRMLRALRWGTEAPTVLELHGGFETAHAWDRTNLLSRLPTLAVDLPGCGASDWMETGTYWPPTSSQDVLCAVEQLAPDATFLVGHSFGGIVALDIVRLAPRRFQHLCLVDVTPGGANFRAERLLGNLEVLRTWRPDREELTARRRLIFPRRTERALELGMDDEFILQLDGHYRFRADMREERWRDPPDLSPLWDALRDFPGSILLVRGEESRVVSEEDTKRLTELRHTAKVLTIADCTHHVPADAPAALSQAFHAALRGVPRTA